MISKSIKWSDFFFFLLIKKQTQCTYKRGIGEDDLRLVGQDVELDDMPIAVPVDDFRVCGEEARKRDHKKATLKAC